MKQNKLLSFILAVATALTVLSGSIAAPILFRPFYYAHIDALSLETHTGWNETVIRDAYNEMLDFCIRGGEFSTGELAWSESGKSHFEDVAALFRFDFIVLAVSAAALILSLVVMRRKKLTPGRLLGRGPAFWAGAGLAGCFLLIAGLASINFTRAFLIFHTLFFPGKDNYFFDYRTDEIILILPEVFFRNCAIFIVALLFLCCAALVAYDLLRYRKKRI